MESHLVSTFGDFQVNPNSKDDATADLKRSEREKDSTLQFVCCRLFRGRNFSGEPKSVDMKLEQKIPTNSNWGSNTNYTS